ncbi:hypothetical protein G210_0167 [Candida maltosa Xu316]|uniref:ditrans,polycis-polyprenyl diphosphate synthase [(2E,6E)-farnesyldiphosphate specific] n=1 Tax=Candida maltosa (strain Xu316) TaxID=1245528 RepID=M3K1K0_CANMX|nr:hypothetical protein G210_0167 [Candida maltosa Xu316]
MMKSPKISDDVRLNNNGNTTLKNITEELDSRKQSDKRDQIHAPPNSFRIHNIFNIILDLSRSLVKTSLTYYPSKSPQVIRDDVNKLSKIPKTISCILDLKDEDDENGGKDGLISSISELTAWSISAGLKKLIIYEFTGTLTQSTECVADLRKYITKTLTLYFGTEAIPTFSIRVPHKNLIIYSDNYKSDKNVIADLEIDLISRVDGKPTLVELTKTMSELAVNRELSIKDITIDLIDEELRELVGPEPDLLISFAPSLNLEDYPPWHIRLSEIYWEPDNKDVNYAVFLRALQQFSNCKINIGK